MVSTTEIKNYYICGSVSKDMKRYGLNVVRAKFEWAKITLKNRSSHNRVYNPMKLCKPDWSWTHCMLVCLRTLVTKCDAIYVLKDHTESRGAKIELKVAKLLKYKVLYE